MRAVLDTNVLVRATKNATGPARELLQQFDTDQHVLIGSNAILVELLRVLDYPRVRAMHRLSEEECQEFVQSLHDAAEVVALPAAPTDAISPDPDDDPVIHTAIHGKADVLCTLDRHLRRQDVQEYCQYHGIQIMTDVELLEQLRRADSNDDEGE